MTLRTPWVSLLVVAGGLLVGLGIAELGLRIAGYEGDVQWRNFVYDPRFGHVEDESWIFEFDAADPAARSIRGQPADARILFLGDSGTEGLHVDIEKTWPRVFQELTGIPAINAGATGMNTIDEYHLLVDELLPLEPEVVVLGFFLANDINFNLRYSDWGTDDPWLDRMGLALREQSALAHFVFLEWLALGIQWGIVERMPKRLRRFLPPEQRLIDETGLQLLSYPEGELATYRESTELLELAYGQLRDVLARFADVAAERGFRFVVVLIPTPSTVAGRLHVPHYPRLLETVRQRGVEVDEARLDLDEPARRVAAICEELRIPCIDPTPEFRAAGGAAFVEGDEHPSELGHEILARACAEAPWTR